jgi:hypothetical protein|tara:strand:+ start:204 stop:461 length:258 start_codon:yes stop_codon:yes gene_type:complete
MENMQLLYESLEDKLQECPDTSGAGQAVVLFRLALEVASNDLGMASAVHLMSRLLSTTLGIMSDEEAVGYEEILHDFETKDQTPN